MSEKQTKNTNEILSNVWNWEHTEDGRRRAIPNPHNILTTEKMIQDINTIEEINKTSDYQTGYRDGFIKGKEEANKLMINFYMNTGQIPPIIIPKGNIQQE